MTDCSPLAHLVTLEELWLSGNRIESWDQADMLATLVDLETIYLEYNPVADEFEYRKKVAELIPCLKQIDANMIGGLVAHGLAPPTVGRPTTSSGGAIQSAEEEMRRLQAAAIARARDQSGK